ncbi:MAG TPA: hypothetical protein VNT75_09765 [Symbiobacteriaceae bacterium]|nr:hypothetical protein [Symbiobacteriaceae bacterium]
MKFIFISIGAALLAYLGNFGLYRSLGARAAATVVPWWEEAVKLGAALAVPLVPMLFVHVAFGALEFVYDLWRGRNDALFLGVLTLAGHGLAGSVAMLVADHLGALWAVYAAAGVTHMLYNTALVYLVLPTLGANIGARR